VLDDLDPAFNLEYYKNCFSSESLFGLPSGIVQGDLWASNVLWKKDDKGNATSELSAIIDWQICAPGNPGSDLSRCLGLNTSTKYRHENEDRLLKLYYDTVNKELDGKIPFTLDQVEMII
jgi:aminoglycoside/choline kinase family phosphotransferase